MKIFLTLLTAIICFSIASGQGGEISGKVLDENEKGIPLANVVLLNDTGAFTGKGTTCNYDGVFNIKRLPFGKYNIRFSYAGYKSETKQGVIIDSSKVTVVDVKLRPTTFSDNPTIVPGPHKFNLSIAELRDTIANRYVIKIMTEEKVSMSCWIDADFRRDNSNVIVYIKNVLQPQILYGLGSAQAKLNIGTLPIGNYNVYVIYNGDTTRGIIKINDTNGIFTLGQGFASTLGEQKFIRIPSNTLWGYVLYNDDQDSILFAKYLGLLKNQGCKKRKITPGDYQVFQIDTNQKFSTRNTHGWRHEHGFIFYCPCDFEKLRELTKRFIHVAGDDRVDVILSNEKGEWFSEVR